MKKYKKYFIITMVCQFFLISGYAQVITILDFQKRLKEMGLYNGKLVNCFSLELKNSIREFQIINGIEVS